MPPMNHSAAAAAAAAAAKPHHHRRRGCWRFSYFVLVTGFAWLYFGTLLLKKRGAFDRDGGDGLDLGFVANDLGNIGRDLGAAGRYLDEAVEMDKVTPPPPPPDRKVFYLSEFGGVGDDAALNTDAFERAVREIERVGGGMLVVEPGVWLTAPFNLTSHMTLYLTEGAVVKGVTVRNLFKVL